MSLLSLSAITSSADIHLPFIKQLYETAFPPEERREFQSLIQLLSQPQGQATMQLLVARDTHFAPVAFAVVWNFATFRFIEHLATAPEQRGKGYGGLIMQLLQPAGKPCLLEVEPLHDEQSEKRIRFYQRLGFTESGLSYHQPPYHPGLQPIPMLLLSHPVVSEMVAISYAGQIHTTVYGLPAPPAV